MEDKVFDTTSDIIRSISDIISLTTPSSDNFTSDIKAAKAYADNLDDNIIDYEFNHIKDCNDVKGSIYTLGKLIKDLNQNKVNIELPNSVPKVINRDIDRVNDSISANTTDIDFINTGIDPSMADSIKNAMEIKPGGIPSLNNNLVIGVEDTLRLGSKAANLIDSDYLKEHEDLLRNNLDLVPGKYIEDQNTHTWDNVLLGNSDAKMRATACEEIATYNALITAGIKADINDFISITRAAEENGTVWGGTLGETPSSIEDYLSNYKFMDGKGNVKPAFNIETTTSNNPTIINNMGKSGKNFIASVYNDKTTIWGQIHTVNITKVGDKYYVHNGKMDGEVSKGYENLYDAIIDIQGNGMGKPLKVIKITNNSSNLNRGK